MDNNSGHFTCSRTCVLHASTAQVAKYLLVCSSFQQHWQGTLKYFTFSSRFRKFDYRDKEK